MRTFWETDTRFRTESKFQRAHVQSNRSIAALYERNDLAQVHTSMLDNFATPICSPSRGERRVGMDAEHQHRDGSRTEYEVIPAASAFRTEGSWQIVEGLA